MSCHSSTKWTTPDPARRLAEGPPARTVRHVLNAAVLAHQGGWDEIAFVLAPLILFAVLLFLARRRVERMPPAGAAEESDTDSLA